VYEKSERCYFADGIAPTLTSTSAGNEKIIVEGSNMNDVKQRIRKLTPKECFRLMDFDDADYENAASVNSNTQLYKQAGNSIVVAVPKFIIAQLVECGALSI
jgi:DNA (cytosine-5)-methyltransferase 1